MFTAKIKALYLFYIIVYFFMLINIWSFMISKITYLIISITKSSDLGNMYSIYIATGILIVIPLSVLFATILFKTVKKSEKRIQDDTSNKFKYYAVYFINILILILFFNFLWIEISRILAYDFDIFNVFIYFLGTYIIIPLCSVLVCVLSFKLIVDEYFPKE